MTTAETAETYSDMFGLRVTDMMAYLAESYFKDDLQNLYNHSSGSFIPDDEQKGPYRGLFGRFFKPCFDLLEVRHPDARYPYEPVHAHDPYGDPMLFLLESNRPEHANQGYKIAVLTTRRIYAAASPTFMIIGQKVHFRRMVRDLVRCRKIYKLARIDRSDHMRRVFIPRHVRENVLERIRPMIEGRRRILRDCGAARLGFLFAGPTGTGKSITANYLQSYITQLVHSRGNRLNVNVTFSRMSSSELKRALSEGMRSNTSSSPTIDITLFDDVGPELFSRKNGKDAASSLLSYLDGGDKFSNKRDRSVKIRVFTTNELVENIDKPFLRPGRIDSVVLFGLPSKQDINDFIDFRYKKVIPNKEDLEHLKVCCQNLTFSEIDAVVDELVRLHILHNEWDVEGAAAVIWDKIKEDETYMKDRRPPIGFAPKIAQPYLAKPADSKCAIPEAQPAPAKSKNVNYDCDDIAIDDNDDDADDNYQDDKTDFNGD